ncbi:hypothetical protein AcW1_007721 [Taiwanofungus camphoratus]|nr:hypothetical protein AcV7_009922 [Antrodia cinnamomea]KAI0953524.1 hypothetical protein AcW1_007721 [Antrodia cinnamomea]
MQLRCRAITSQGSHIKSYHVVFRIRCLRWLKRSRSFLIVYGRQGKEFRRDLSGPQITLSSAKFLVEQSHRSLQSTVSSWMQRNALFICSALSLQPSPQAPSPWLAVAALFGLPITLWAYKCLMMVLFQRKIIYMGYAPPGARTEELGVGIRTPRGIQCEEIALQSEKRVFLSGIIMRASSSPRLNEPRVVIVYLQGNAGNPLARIPVFERLILGMPLTRNADPSLDVVVVAVAPRSYWKSSRTPSERGLMTDYQRVLSYASQRFPTSTIVLYGHSLGGAIAVCLSSQLSSAEYPNVKGLILENPFSSIPGMMRALYPQHWLPYRYLAPLAFDKWDAVSAMRNAKHNPGSLLERLSRSMLMLLSERDEVVPTSMGLDLYEASGSGAGDAKTGLELRRCVIIRDALHELASMERQWLVEMQGYLRRFEDESYVLVNG